MINYKKKKIIDKTYTNNKIGGKNSVTKTYRNGDSGIAN